MKIFGYHIKNNQQSLRIMIKRMITFPLEFLFKKCKNDQIFFFGTIFAEEKRVKDKIIQ